MSALEKPFKFGTVVDGGFFTGRADELSKISQLIAGHKHLPLIGPRGYGKTSLVRKAILLTGRPALFVDVQMATSACGLPSFCRNPFSPSTLGSATRAPSGMPSGHSDPGRR